MAGRVLDTNILINYWHKCAGGRPLKDITSKSARKWGEELRELLGRLGAKVTESPT